MKQVLPRINPNTLQTASLYPNQLHNWSLPSIQTSCELNLQRRWQEWEAWSREEHGRFLLGFQMYGHDWHNISAVVGSKSSDQVRLHFHNYMLECTKFRLKEYTLEEQIMDMNRMYEAALVLMVLARGQRKKESPNTSQDDVEEYPGKMDMTCIENEEEFFKYPDRLLGKRVFLLTADRKLLPGTIRLVRHQCLYVVYDKDPEVNSLSDHGWIDISCAKEMLVFGTNLVVSANHDHQQPWPARVLVSYFEKGQPSYILEFLCTSIFDNPNVVQCRPFQPHAYTRQLHCHPDNTLAQAIAQAKLIMSS